jgi:HEPN domain-containing protein
MPPDELVRGTPQEWLRRAKSNLTRAKQLKPDEVLWEDLCFDTQQATEKAVKAVLVLRGIEFPKTHDIRALLTLLAQAQQVPPDIWEAVDLTDYAVETRYPGRIEAVTEDEYDEAVILAERVVRWVEQIVAATPAAGG